MPDLFSNTEARGLHKAVLALPCASRHKNILVQISEHFEAIFNAAISFLRTTAPTVRLTYAPESKAKINEKAELTISK